MSSTRLAQTARTTLQAVDPRLIGQYEVLADLVRRRVGRDHATLFAEPVPVSSGKDAGAVLWFSAEDGDARPVEALPPEEAASLRAEADRLMTDLRAFAARLDGEGPASREAAGMLRDALIVPDEGALWSVDSRPVLVGWGHRRSAEREAAPARAFVTAAGPPSSPLPASSPDAAGDGSSPAQDRMLSSPARAASWQFPWALALATILTVLCLALLAQRLMSACAFGQDYLPAALQSAMSDTCPAPAASVASSAAIVALDTDLKRRERDLMGRALSCSAARAAQPQRRAETPVSPIAAAPTGVSEPERRLENVRRGRVLEVTLLWEGPADLDLHISCPGGERIAFNNQTGCGGALAADLNSGGGAPDARPIEHIVWDRDPSPSGSFNVAVNLYKRYGDLRPRIPYRVVLWREGQQVRQESGDVTTPGTYVPVLTFNSPPRP